MVGNELREHQRKPTSMFTTVRSRRAMMVTPVIIEYVLRAEGKMWPDDDGATRREMVRTLHVRRHETHKLRNR